jgi:hypothetical protein
MSCAASEPVCCSSTDALGAAPNGGELPGRNPTDRGKSGAKISVLTDANGTPLGVLLAPANRHDSPPLGPTLDSSLIALPAGATLEIDHGYRGQPSRDRAAERGLRAHVS